MWEKRCDVKKSVSTEEVRPVLRGEASPVAVVAEEVDGEG